VLGDGQSWSRERDEVVACAVGEAAFLRRESTWPLARVPVRLRPTPTAPPCGRGPGADWLSTRRRPAEAALEASVEDRAPDPCPAVVSQAGGVGRDHP
jgi:hypothetical protein